MRGDPEDMPATVHYLVQAKEQTRWTSLGPFGQMEDAERAFQQAMERPAVTYARLLSESQSAGDEPVYEVLRIRHRSGSILVEAQGDRGELASRTAPPSAQVTTTAPNFQHPTLIEVVSHRVVYYEPGRFSAWPANSGGQAWCWGNEILVGFSDAVYEEKEGHNYALPTRRSMARSVDSGTPGQFTGLHLAVRAQPWEASTSHIRTSHSGSATIPSRTTSHMIGAGLGQGLMVSRICSLTPQLLATNKPPRPKGRGIARFASQRPTDGCTD